MLDEQPDVQVDVTLPDELPPAAPESEATSVAHATADMINHDRLLAFEERLQGHVTRDELAALLESKADREHTHIEYVTRAEAEHLADETPADEPEVIEVAPPDVPEEAVEQPRQYEPPRIEGFW